jgi:hypothetical protein
MSIFGRYPDKLDQFKFYIKKGRNETHVFDTIDSGNSLQELLAKLVKLQESDAPANSTANIATYAKPMTFKMFKRKMDLK